jgi:hypothetical protein
VLVCACVGRGVGVCGGEGESCHEMAWGGNQGGGIRGRRRGLVGGCED